MGFAARFLSHFFPTLRHPQALNLSIRLENLTSLQDLSGLGLLKLLNCPFQLQKLMVRYANAPHT